MDNWRCDAQSAGSKHSRKKICKLVVVQEHLKVGYVR